jgi:hypothetical protein
LRKRRRVALGVENDTPAIQSSDDSNSHIYDSEASDAADVSSAGFLDNESDTWDPAGMASSHETNDRAVSVTDMNQNDDDELDEVDDDWQPPTDEDGGDNVVDGAETDEPDEYLPGFAEEYGNINEQLESNSPEQVPDEPFCIETHNCTATKHQIHGYGSGLSWTLILLSVTRKSLFLSVASFQAPRNPSSWKAFSSLA